MLEKKISTRQIGRIVWAVDPFETDLTIDPKSVQELNAWAVAQDVTIEPVYIFTPFSEVETLAAGDIAAKMDRLFSAAGLKTAPAKVILNSEYLTISAVNKLVEHAEKTRADMIVVSSHGRRGLPRMLFGSFAEALLLVSPFPVLFMNQKAMDRKVRFQRVLWATDFSQDSERAFDVFQSQFKKLCSDIVLFHDISLQFELRSAFSEFDPGVPLREDLIRRQAEWAHGQANHWMEAAVENGYRAESMLEAGYSKIATEIMSVAMQKEAGLVVMVSRSNAFEAVLFGSHAREVFRKNEVPVLVYGPRFCEIALRAEKEAKLEWNHQMDQWLLHREERP